MNPLVLTIDDDPAITDLLSVLLSANGFDVLAANSGIEGLRLIKDQSPRLVILDLMMPDIDGWEVYQAMKASDQLKNIPVIIITAKAQSIDKVLGLHIAKVDDYITKPFSPQELLQSVEKVLGAQEAGS